MWRNEKSRERIVRCWKRRERHREERALDRAGGSASVGGWNVVGSYQHNVDTNSLLLPRIEVSMGGWLRDTLFGSGWGWSAGKVDEIEIEQAEGTDSSTGFRIQRKIKTRPNGDAEESFTSPPLPLHWKLCWTATNPKILERFPLQARNDTFF